MSPASSSTGEFGKRPVITLTGPLTWLRLIQNNLHSCKTILCKFRVFSPRKYDDSFLGLFLAISGHFREYRAAPMHCWMEILVPLGWEYPTPNISISMCNPYKYINTKSGVFFIIYKTFCARAFPLSGSLLLLRNHSGLFSIASRRLSYGTPGALTPNPRWKGVFIHHAYI